MQRNQRNIKSNKSKVEIKAGNQDVEQTLAARYAEERHLHSEATIEELRFFGKLLFILPGTVGTVQPGLSLF